jgi:hemoglobin
MAAHQEVHRRESFRVEHFERWFSLWTASVDSKWRGPIAEHAKTHAARTAGLISRRLCATGWEPAAASPPCGTGRSDG